MPKVVLEFEKPIIELEQKVAEMKKLSETLDIEEEIKGLEEKIQQLKRRKQQAFDTIFCEEENQLGELTSLNRSKLSKEDFDALLS